MGVIGFEVASLCAPGTVKKILKLAPALSSVKSAHSL